MVTGSTLFYALYGSNGGNDPCTANFGASSFTNSVPSGFVSWDDSSISLYTGSQPRLIQRANPALGQNSDVVLATYTSNVGGSWNQLSGTSSTATDNGFWEFIIDCDGTQGWVNVGDWLPSGQPSSVGNYWLRGIPVLEYVPKQTNPQPIVIARGTPF
jgi:hypothetical protein